MHAGVFAHQTPIFDSFTASSDYPMQVTTEPGKGGPQGDLPAKGSSRVCMQHQLTMQQS